MSNHPCDDMKSMEVDDLPKQNFSVAPAVCGSLKNPSNIPNSQPKRSIVDLCESSASSPAKSQRKNKDCASEIEVDSYTSARQRQKGLKLLPVREQGQPSERPAYRESYKHTGNMPTQIGFVKSVAQTSQAVVVKALPPYTRREIYKFGARSTSSIAHNVVPLLQITDLSETALRFAIEGRILNNYGTLKLRLDDAKFPRYFKVDIVDKQNSDTMTVVVEESLLTHFVPRLPVGRYVKIEGASIKRKNKVDGGTSAYSIYVDSATTISDIPPFPITLTFFPEQTLRQFFDEARLQHTRGAKQHLGTLAFVVIQADNLEPRIGATRGELLVADGPTVGDRATLTFVNDRKDDYANILKDVEQGLTLTFIARNISVFMSRENTLSVLDLTVLLPVRSPRLRQQLVETYDKQMEYLGFGKEVHGDLVFTNINGVLIEVVCYVCKSNKVYKVADGVYCIVCLKITKSLESVRLHAKIRIDKDTVIATQLIGPIVDKVLHLQKPFRQLYAESVIGLREVLAYTVHRGLFRLNRAGNVCDFIEEKM